MEPLIGQSEHVLGSVMSQIAKEFSDMSVDDSSPGSSSAGEEKEFLLQWLSRGGAKFSKIHLRLYDDDSEHRGVHAAEEILPGEQILMVPHALIMTTEV
jgi:hypothetical protein